MSGIVTQAGMFGGRRGGGGFDPDAAIVIDAMTTAPDSARQTLISDTITALKTAGVWGKLDEIWFRAAHTSQAGLLGWKRAADSFTVGTVVFTADRGFDITAGGSYIDTGYSSGANIGRNSSLIGFYSRTNDSASSADIGRRAGFNFREFNIYAGIAQFKINTNSNNLNPSIGNSLGLFVGNRSSSTSVQAYHNGVLKGSATDTSVDMFTGNIFELALNNNGNAAFSSPRQSAGSFVGGSLTAAEHESLYNIIQAYMTAVGANV